MKTIKTNELTEALIEVGLTQVADIIEAADGIAIDDLYRWRLYDEFNGETLCTDYCVCTNEDGVYVYSRRFEEGTAWLWPDEPDYVVEW